MENELTLGALPEELLQEIFQHLTAVDIMTVRTLCKKCARIVSIQDQSFWKRSALLVWNKISQEINTKDHNNKTIGLNFELTYLPKSQGWNVCKRLLDSTPLIAGGLEPVRKYRFKGFSIFIKPQKFLFELERDDHVLVEDHYSKITGLYNHCGEIYTGSFTSSFRMEGIGTLHYLDNSVYTGEFLNNTRHGLGTYTFATGEEYTGEFSCNSMTGKGIRMFKDGSVYDGYWLDGVEHGSGLRIYTGVHTEIGQYEGEWRHGEKQGRGIMRFKNGNIYDGFWRENRMNGRGIMQYSNQSEYKQYKGHWKDNQRDGVGTMVWKDGSSSYEGEWSKSGRAKGTMIWWRGEAGASFNEDSWVVYRGEWRKEEMEGSGFGVDQRGNVFVGRWIKGKRREIGGIYLFKVYSGMNWFGSFFYVDILMGV